MSMFQQRHYEAVAKQMRTIKGSMFVTAKEDTDVLWNIIVDRLSVMFYTDNLKFNPHKFRNACGQELENWT